MQLKFRSTGLSFFAHFLPISIKEILLDKARFHVRFCCSAAYAILLQFYQCHFAAMLPVRFCCSASYAILKFCCSAAYAILLQFYQCHFAAMLPVQFYCSATYAILLQFAILPKLVNC